MKPLLILLLLFLILNSSKAEASSWTKETYAKQKIMMDLGFTKKLSTYVIDRCKATARNPAKCVRTASFIAKAESNAGQDAYKHNVWGINEGKKYKSDEANFERWLKSYNIWWYNSPYPIDYYPARGEVSKTRYCTDEHSSKSTKGCPNGLRIAKATYDLFK